MRRAEQGQSLVFFPEGTFTSESGLRKFHMGAFATAMRAGCPLVPAVIHGARRALPNDARIPRRGPIRVEVLEPLRVDAAHDAIETLRDAARHSILARLDEPDLLAAAPAGQHA
jgi:1-acyl-sn-glycerol-3-phosphate acyltransferase